MLFDVRTASNCASSLTSSQQQISVLLCVLVWIRLLTCQDFVEITTPRFRIHRVTQFRKKTRDQLDAKASLSSLRLRA
jgi:hypothetical protein